MFLFLPYTTAKQQKTLPTSVSQHISDRNFWLLPADSDKVTGNVY